MQLTRPTILTAAIAILDEYGLADTTMRRIAKQLSVAPGALYWHFPNKQALLAGIAVELLRPLIGAAPLRFLVNDGAQAAGTQTDRLAMPDEETMIVVDTDGMDWQEALRTRAMCLRTCMLTVTDGSDVVATALANEELHSRVLEACALPLQDVVPDEKARRIAASTVVDFVVGSTVGEQSRQRLAQFTTKPAPTQEQADAAYRAAFEAAVQSVSNGVDLIIAGIAARAQ
ncbi:TetR/AcrR family transcriptional regulator [Corynebacterium sp. 13CS0277]|uniref:TetR/AcrR family transcriptional regulator n=1 Tax=Corynebacterium sp. 13CS0277 TaxID=2071994 RepID=UPI0011B2395F|nr:TetR/AcrR family transcriptional regulator [Corynebacterium sp. 13CS0277]